MQRLAMKNFSSILLLLSIGHLKTSKASTSACTSSHQHVWSAGLHDCHGNITLVCGKSAHEGILVICLGKKWFAACEDSWGQLETDVACRQLGFNSGETIENPYSEWLGTPSPVLNCSASQDNTTLAECVTDMACKESFLPGILCHHHHPSLTSSAAIPGTTSIVQPSATTSVPVTGHETTAIPGTDSIVQPAISSVPATGQQTIAFSRTGSIVQPSATSSVSTTEWETTVISGTSSIGQEILATGQVILVTSSIEQPVTSSIPATRQVTTHAPQSTSGNSPYDITTTTGMSWDATHSPVATPPTTPTQPSVMPASRTPLPIPRPSGPTHLGGAGGDSYPPEAVAFLTLGLLCVVVTSVSIVGVAVVILAVRLRQRRSHFRVQRCGQGSDDLEIQNTIYSNSEAHSDPVKTDDVTYTEHCPVYEEQPVYEDVKSAKEDYTRSQSMLDSDIFDDKKYFRTSEFF